MCCLALQRALYNSFRAHICVYVYRRVVHIVPRLCTFMSTLVCISVSMLAKRSHEMWAEKCCRYAWDHLDSVALHRVCFSPHLSPVLFSVKFSLCYVVIEKETPKCQYWYQAWIQYWFGFSHKQTQLGTTVLEVSDLILWWFCVSTSCYQWSFKRLQQIWLEIVFTDVSYNKASWP